MRKLGHYPYYLPDVGGGSPLPAGERLFFAGRWRRRCSAGTAVAERRRHLPCEGEPARYSREGKMEGLMFYFDDRRRQGCPSCVRHKIKCFCGCYWSFSQRLSDYPGRLVDNPIFYEIFGEIERYMYF